MIRVMIIDDSAVMRSVLQDILQKHRGIEVIGTASDPIFAQQRMAHDWPDVIVLDVEMPRMDGITFLRKIMAERPTPTVICSSLTEAGAETTLQALEAGAVSIITKPTTKLTEFLRDYEDDFIAAIREASVARLSNLRPHARTSSTGAISTRQEAPSSARTTSPVPERLSADAVLAPAAGRSAMTRTTDQIVAIGTSTGGTQALEFLFTHLPATTPGIVVVQHMPPMYTKSFANRLNQLSKVSIKEAETGDRILPGHALIAPGGKHMMIRRNGAQYDVEVVDGPLVSRHRPSVDVLFRSAAKAAGANALGIIMTGMGDDGARGLKEMFDVGAQTVAQDEASCVVFGMPKEAIRHGGVQETLALSDIPAHLLKHGGKA
ncbi:MAG: chemotaxis response regulator protein-glutamate methylesterase [Candidatus Dactylopiibacterium carminicum]|uniref:Protein-glutamate methylesterase/protein-glutamine glutaminase n=1 Tax=Candidatus Dactylopiibacterium carminicum TaxID=857335 RepID=A0A272EUL3_9RHOO|nr:chemotaxis response regulator protein-glutamate methylesterase [Candidatus Dactylopiibacterium carminicum]KAF7600387.1 chemotaxis response regulator protein-glutamate methylesterase [Candidatus Dactylopiibacterium carminicum]PAS93785.1 MAG: chemotaxis response regulator protein-glutamate methylesterase [Candidatus Dactylopiibacterium carminicum]PAS96823.1 MAG: chemotaxis response regulator protein-glutamate methylesterase [Candidatus Dactylopiibacterium carminicum]PAT00387.1 MAG: chemotaxis 